MPRRPPPLVIFILAAILLWPAGAANSAPLPAPAADITSAFAFFPETGHNIGLRIKRFYEANGGLGIFGLPLTEVLVEDGLQVQYFERARFELHPELPANFSVSLTRIGALFTSGRAEPEFQWLTAAPSSDGVFFAESGHSLGGVFRDFWQQRGGLAVFGYPISQELNENGLRVQYFERARFEHHPESAGSPYEVQLGLLGRQLLEQRPDALALSAPTAPLTLLGKATTGFAASALERRTNIARATAMFDGVVVPAGQEYSFLSAGDFSEANGFVEGYGIVGGKLEKVIGGGLCQVSTTMFRAVSNAGLAITSRVGHTYVVYFYENILGFDATVFSPYRDFRWRNDTAGPVYFATSTNPAAATVTFEVWGFSDGRKTSYQGPFLKNVVRPGRAIWQYDRTLPAGTTDQLVHGRSGMDVTYIRTVTMPNGAVVHNDNFFTRYQPWNDFYLYGAGVRPPANAQVIGPRATASDPAPEQRDSARR